MANTRSATLSVRLKPETKKRLARLAKASGRRSNFLIADAVEAYVSDQEGMLAEVRQADRQVKSGHYIKSEDMKAWLLSWGTEHELPVPKCACGKEHDDETLCQQRLSGLPWREPGCGKFALTWRRTNRRQRNG
jgi:predicted transcriptional regulator